MKVINAKYEILTDISEGGIKELKHIESIGRNCYKSENRITEDGESAKKFVSMLIKNGHEAMIEHVSVSVRFTVDRGVSHELVRHRLASWAQESTRYCNYSKGQFGKEITVIKPCFWEEGSPEYKIWETAMQQAEDSYMELLKAGASAEKARSILPNSLKTEVNMTANIREWRTFFKLRTDVAAHPQMREVAIPLLMEFKERMPVFFDDITLKEEETPKTLIYWEEGSISDVWLNDKKVENGANVTLKPGDKIAATATESVEWQALIGNTRFALGESPEVEATVPVSFTSGSIFFTGVTTGEITVYDGDNKSSADWNWRVC